MTGVKENDQAYHQLEGALQLLANSTDLKVNIEALKASIDKVIPETNSKALLIIAKKFSKNSFCY